MPVTTSRPRARLGGPPQVFACFAIGLAIASLAAPVRAQELSSHEQQARSLFEAGRTAFESGRFEQALRHFEESYELSQRPALLFNIASAADRLQRNERALEAYRAYLEALPDAPNRELAQARIAFLEERVRAVPSPREAAATVIDGSTTPLSADAGSGDVTGQWWFWTAIGVAATAVVVAIVASVAAANPSIQDPPSGDFAPFLALTER